jgi:putative transcriptional regulator
MTATVDLSGHFLMAMPGLVGGDLAGTVIYVCEHSERGALGLVINRPIDLTLGHLLEKADLEGPPIAGADTPVHFGGPVQTDRGFVLHHPPGEYSSSIHLNDSLALTTSRDVLQAAASGQGPQQMFVTLGYAGWGAGQLEQELAQNAWLSVLAEEFIIFETPPEARYPAAMRLLGIDPAMLAGSAGHA